MSSGDKERDSRRKRSRSPDRKHGDSRRRSPDRKRSRSPSPRRDRYARDRNDRDRNDRDRRDDRNRNDRRDDRDRHDRERRDDRNDRDRKKNKREEKEYSKNKDDIEEKTEEVNTEVLDPNSEEYLMAQMGIPTGFDTTKGKKVEGTDVSAQRVMNTRVYRQYMNRKGGFNRLLEPEPSKKNRLRMQKPLPALE